MNKQQKQREPIDTVCRMRPEVVGGKRQLRGKTRWELPKGALVRLIKWDDTTYLLTADTGSGRRINNAPETLWSFVDDLNEHQ